MGRRWDGCHRRDVGLSVIMRMSVLWLLLSTALMAQSSTSSVQVVYPLTPFRCGFNGIAATLTQCQAAPGAGLKLYITRLHIQTTTTTSGTYALQYGTGTNCGTGTTALFPMTATGDRYNAPITSQSMAALAFDPPISGAANTALCVIGVATNTVKGQISGFIAP